MQNTAPKANLIPDEVNIPEHKVGDSTILFLDPSSSCTGYCVAKVDFAHKKATVFKAGAIWFDKHLENQDKYHYMFLAIANYFNIICQIDYCVCEAYMLNPEKRSGCAVGPELSGAIQVALSEIGVKHQTIPVQTWRSQLGIKPEIIKGKKYYKDTTKKEVEKYVKIPDTILSNVTKMERKTPHDLTDAIAICLGFLKKVGIKTFNFDNIEIQKDFKVDV
jgi:Holliday junction resolvasome RuvABC endonuclease subunit